MERLILVLSVFVIVALGGVRADECTHASFTVQYGKCYMKYSYAINMKVSSRNVSHCTGHIQKAAKYVCNHMDDVLALPKCATNPSRYTKCMANAVKEAADLCTRLNAFLACTTQFYEKCTATQREVSKNLLFMSHPGDCSKSQECSYASFTDQYGGCHRKYSSAINMKVSSRNASHCTRASNELVNCFKTLLDRCKNNSDLIWFQSSHSGGNIQKSAKYVCDHVDDFKALTKCATNPPRYNKCTAVANQGSVDFCKRLSALVACATQYYEKCTATQREVAKKFLLMKFPGDCSTSITNRGTKTGVGLALLALPSFILLYALTW